MRRIALQPLALALAAGLTATSAHAYRTAGDLADFEGTTRVGWPGGVTSFVLVDDIPGAVGGVGTNAELIASALQAWMDVSCTSVVAGLEGTTSADASYGDGTNTIQWVRSGWEDLGFQPGASGATDLVYEEVDGQWVIVEADVYLNLEAHEWTTGAATEDTPEGTAEVVGVLTHELGHALGLLHPCEESGEPACTNEMRDNPSTMYPAYSHGQLELVKDDRDGICFLYPACDENSCADQETCTKNGCAAVCGDVTCGVGEQCWEGECLDFTDPCSIDPVSCIVCEEDDDCGEGYECSDSACFPVWPQSGDPCEEDDLCTTGECGAGDFCAASCLTDEACGEDGRCDEDSYQCTEDSREPLGGPCDSADDCLGERCLSELSEAPMCTRACRAEPDDCPLDWTCGEADGEAVCVPPAPPLNVKGCGCSQAGLEPQRLHPFFTAGLLGAVVFLARRRRLRTIAQHPLAGTEQP
jgi:hypothetical protein